jgi:hypothetical protein
LLFVLAHFFPVNPSDSVVSFFCTEAHISPQCDKSSVGICQISSSPVQTIDGVTNFIDLHFPDEVPSVPVVNHSKSDNAETTDTTPPSGQIPFGTFN